MLFFRNKFKIYKGKIKVANKKIQLVINFKEETHYFSFNSIKKAFGSVEFFVKWFNKLFLPIIKNTIETDNHISKFADKIKKIQIDLYHALPKTGIKFLDERTSSFDESTGGYFKNQIISLKIEPFIQGIHDYFKKGKFNSQFFSKVLKHELVHYYDFLISNLKKKEQTLDKITSYLDFNDDFISYLPYRKFLLDCRREGLASFTEHRNRERLYVDRKTIWTKDPYIYGEYMVTIISLEILRKENRLNEVKLILRDKIFSVDKINELLEKTKEGVYFYITKIPEDVHLRTERILLRLDPLNFLKIYDSACNNFNISQENKGVLTLLNYEALKKEFDLENNKVD